MHAISLDQFGVMSTRHLLGMSPWICLVDPQRTVIFVIVSRETIWRGEYYTGNHLNGPQEPDSSRQSASFSGLSNLKLRDIILISISAPYIPGFQKNFTNTFNKKFSMK